jgi:hypothetical protein
MPNLKPIIGFGELAPAIPKTKPRGRQLGGRRTERAGHTGRTTHYPITEAEYNGLQLAYSNMNAKLFDDVLPNLLITLNRKSGAGGYFSADRFTYRDGDGTVHQHELALNPDGFVGRTDEWIISVLVHEQAHCWEVVNGSAPKRHYHNKIWAQKMMDIGLMPSSTGAVGGKVTGTHMSHYILPDGPFAKAFADLAASGWKLNLQSTPVAGREGGRASKTKFSCPSCGQNVWAKPNTLVTCWACMAMVLPPDGMQVLEPFQLRPAR